VPWAIGSLEKFSGGSCLGEDHPVISTGFRKSFGRPLKIVSQLSTLDSQLIER
jgi:hypothetical protein